MKKISIILLAFLLVPIPGNLSAWIQANPGTKAEGQSWDAFITATSSSGDDAVFGVRPDASSGFDSAYDIPEPPAPPEPPYLRAYFYYPEQTPDKLHRSCLAPENLMEWPLRIEHEDGVENITLTWDVENIPSKYSVLLYLGESLTADMMVEENYTFESTGGDHNFRITVGLPTRLPTQPQLSSPDNGSEVPTNTPTLRWENAMYAENHRVLLDDDSNPDNGPLHDNTVEGDDKWTTPTLTEDETYYWKVIAQNENGENHSVIWHFTVNAEEPQPPPLNRAPIADAGGPYWVHENEIVGLDGTGSTDPDDDPLTYSWTVIDDPTGEASLTDDDTATPLFHAPEHVDNAVDVTVQLGVNDGHGHTDSNTATVTIQPAGVNLPPTADAGGPYSVQENETIELDGTGSSDSDGEIVAYSWTITDDPTGEASLTDSDTATPVFHAPSVESDTDVTVELTVEDDDGATDTDTAIVTVRTAGVGPSQYELFTLASPPDGGTVTLDPLGGIYEEGTEVTVTAEPADNYEFDHWSGDASGTSASVKITMDSDKIVTAHFRSISEKGEGLPLIQLGVGIIILLAIVIFTIFAMLTTRKRRLTRSLAR